MPTVSVIIPTYNRCETLKKAVKSVFDQTYRDYEIIIVNDGSTDGTTNYLTTIQNDNFHFITFDRNRGGNHARNEGIDKARGEYLAFLDDDDQWASNKLEEQMICFTRDNIDVCYTGLNVFSSDNSFIKYVFKEPAFQDIFKSIMKDNFIGGSSSIMVKRERIFEAGCFDTALPALQDWDLLIRLFKNGCSLQGINKPLVSYHIVDVNRSITCSHRNFKLAALYLLKKYENDQYAHLLKHGLRLIEFKRIFKSRRFLFDTLKYYTDQLIRRRR